MPRSLTSDDIIRALMAVLREPVDRSYPLPPYETPSQWAGICEGALRDMAGRGMFGLRDREGTSLAKTLLRAARGEVAPTLASVPGKVRMLGGLVRNLVDPGRINQGYKGTCAVTSLESFLAERQPAEYARLVSGLMALGGTVTLASGATMRRDESSLVWSRTEAWRSPVSRLFQVAAMERAYPDLDYRNTIDAHIQAGNTVEGSINTGTGVDLKAFDTLLQELTGQEWEILSRASAQAAATLARLGLDISGVANLDRDGWRIVTHSLAAGDAVFVTLNTGNLEVDLDPEQFPYVLPHKVRVLSFDDQADRVFYEDPLDPTESWIPGVETRVEDDRGRCSMSRPDFLKLMDELSYLPAHYQPPTTAPAE
jgi:hypothetical protein